MIASASDAQAYSDKPNETVVAYALETMYNYTAYFTDNDQRLVYTTVVAITTPLILTAIEGKQTPPTLLVLKAL